MHGLWRGNKGQVAPEKTKPGIAEGDPGGDKSSLAEFLERPQAEQIGALKV